MFQEFMEILIDTLQRLNYLDYINNIAVGPIEIQNSIDVFVTGATPDLGDVIDLILPVYPPEVPPADPADDYLPQRKQPLVLVLGPRIIIPDPGNKNYDPNSVALACLHTLSFTDGALTDFMGVEHEMSHGTQTPGPMGFTWVTYRLDTLKVERVGRINDPAGMEIQLRAEGYVWLHPPAAPEPVLITEVSVPAQPPMPGAQALRGHGEMVRIMDDPDGR